MDNAIFDTILLLISTTTLSVTKACRAVGAAQGDFYGFIADDQSGKRKERYDNARDMQMEILVDEIRELEDECVAATKAAKQTKGASAVFNSYQQKIKNRQWLATCLRHSRYGQNTADTNVTIPTGPLEVVVKKNNATQER